MEQNNIHLQTAQFLLEADDDNIFYAAKYEFEPDTLSLTLK